MSLGDLSDVDTEVDDSLSMLSPSLVAPLLHTEQEEEEGGATPSKVGLEAQSSSTDPFGLLFDGLVITGQEEGGTWDKEVKEQEKGKKPVSSAENKAEEVVIERSIAPSSAKDTEAMVETKPIVQEEQDEIIVEGEGARRALPEPPPQPPPPRSFPQRQYQQQKNNVHYPDIPGASLLELAERAESRLAFGAATHTLSDTPMAAAVAPPVFSSSSESPFVSSAGDGEENGDSQIVYEDSNVGEEGQAFRKQLLVARLVSQLETSSSNKTQLTSTETSSGGGGGGQNTSSMGTNLAARAFVSPQLEPIFKRGGGAVAPSIPSVIAKYLGIVAVGTSTGVLNVLMPKSPGRGPPQLHSLEDKSTAGDAVTALAMGQHAGGLLLLSGHASGQLRLWETKPVSGTGGGGGSSRHSSSSGSSSGAGVTWVSARTVAGAHATAVTACTVIDGGATTWALSADAHGRLMCHSVNRLLSITAQALAGFART